METKKYLEMINKSLWDKRIINLWQSLSEETKSVEIPEFPKILKKIIKIDFNILNKKK